MHEMVKYNKKLLTKQYEPNMTCGQFVNRFAKGYAMTSPIEAAPSRTLKNKQRDVSFNDALNKFYLRLYGVTHIVKDHSDSEKGNHYSHMASDTW